MPDYGDVSYWNNRYGAEYTETFDWLFTYEDVKQIISQIFQSDSQILMVGSGNATFSSDLYHAGYHKITNIDLSDVVISQMKQKYPMMEWLTMDALDMEFPTGSQANVIDKSLIDTILCYQNSVPCTKQLLREFYRVLAPGGILVSFSLHSIAEIESYFHQDGMNWTVQTYLLRNPRWDREEATQRSVSHSLILAQKAPVTLPIPFQLQGTLLEEEYQILKAESDKIRDDHIFKKASIQTLVQSLDAALELLQDIQYDKLSQTSSSSTPTTAESPSNPQQSPDDLKISPPSTSPSHPAPINYKDE